MSAVALGVRCPTCRSPIGKGCVNPQGKPRDVHVDREAVAAVAPSEP